MGAAGLIQIKRRIKSVQSTKKITNAMGLVATSKLRKCRKELSLNEGYFKQTEEIMNELMGLATEKSESLFIKGNNSNNKLYIVVTSDSGLCGGYNGNIVSYLGESLQEQKENAKIITVGSKGLAYTRRLNIETVAEYIDIPDVPTVKEVKKVLLKALNLYKEGDVSEVNVVYSEFFSPVKQVPRIERLLPIEVNGNEISEPVIEPNIDIVFNNAVECYLKGKLRNAILSAKCSEQSARMTAMDGATQNANDILSDLNLRYNRIRQSMITQEISEIVGGAEAQK
ncbi:MAG: ATP synthase F1 subunit gamma [Clostridium sp.]